MRDYLFFCFGIYSGLRVSDLLRLQVKMVRGKTHVQITEKKNVHDKQFIIHPSIREDLEHYIKNMKDDDFIFPSRQIKTKERLRKQPFHRSTAYRMLNKAARRFGLRQIGCHTLRKTWGYQLYVRDPRNIALLMKMYGHRDSMITLDYIGMTQDLMDEAIMGL
ncbi:tyrosine-type recombinase/integrase [Paenibacillus cellulosilyticus]